MDKSGRTIRLLTEAVALHRAGSLTDAAALYRAILESDATNADALKLLGTVYFQTFRPEEAVELIGNSLTINPSQADAYNNLGLALKSLQRYDEALASYDKAIALKPEYADAYNNKGIALQETRGYGEALACYEKATALNPRYADAYFNRGAILFDLKRYDEALENYEKAATLNPNVPCLLGAWLYLKMYICDWSGMDAIVERIKTGIQAHKPVADPFTLLGTPLPEASQLACAENYVKNNYPPSASPLWKGEKYSHDRIRIGYFSSDFRNHPTTYLMAQFFELHDRSKFEITAFSFAPPAKDDVRERLEKAFDHFIDVKNNSDQEIAALARKQEIDIVVNLNGLIANARTGIFARRPAPVQVSYLGYPGTMGASYMDYLIADPIVIPQEHRQYYTEKIVYLPNSYQANDSSRKISDRHFSRKELGLPENGFVFCCFNNNYKITPDIFDIWMRLLKNVEGSVLWLFEGNETVVRNLREEARTRGIAEERLVFARRMDMADHLARHQLADLFLDTLPYNAHTTASDALWAGLPVVSCLGETFAGRVAASLLNATGLPELITRSRAEYEALALELATNSPKLTNLRQKLLETRGTCPLFNTKLFTRHMEKAYIKMWEKSQASLVPADIDIH